MKYLKCIEDGASVRVRRCQSQSQVIIYTRAERHLEHETCVKKARLCNEECATNRSKVQYQIDCANLQKQKQLNSLRRTLSVEKKNYNEMSKYIAIAQRKNENYLSKFAAEKKLQTALRSRLETLEHQHESLARGASKKLTRARSAYGTLIDVYLR
jgi:hypothetical protein